MIKSRKKCCRMRRFLNLWGIYYVACTMFLNLWGMYLCSMYYLGTGWLYSHANALFGDVGPNKVSGRNLESPMNVWESLVLRYPGKPPCLGSEKVTRMRMTQRVMRTIKPLSSFSRTPPRTWCIGRCSKWRRFIPKPRKRSCCSMHKLHPTWRECLSKWGSWTCTVIFYLVVKKTEMNNSYVCQY